MSAAEPSDLNCRSRLFINGKVVASLIVREGSRPSFLYSEDVFPEAVVASEAAVALYEALSVGKKRKRSRVDVGLGTLTKRKRSLINAIDKAAERARDTHEENETAALSHGPQTSQPPRLDTSATLLARSLPVIPPQSPRPTPVSV